MSRQSKLYASTGRIAQLVEHLPYTQVVIGSSPVAPIDCDAGVVQLVRALACHARSCEFESRLPRIFEPIQNRFNTTQTVVAFLCSNLKLFCYG